MGLSLGIGLRVSDQGPCHPDHAVKTGGELMRLCDHLEGAGEPLDQGWQDEVGAECGQVLQREPGVEDSKL